MTLRWADVETKTRKLHPPEKVFRYWQRINRWEQLHEKGSPKGPESLLDLGAKMDMSNFIGTSQHMDVIRKLQCLIK